MKQNKKRRLLRNVLRWILRLLCLLIGAAVFALAVIMGQPQETETTPIDQPLTAPAPQINVDMYGDFRQLQEGFPAPVLFFTAGAAPVLTGGNACDTAFEDGCARIVTLNYSLQDGGAITLQSVYPARAVSLLSQSGWRLRRSVPVRIAGILFARMEGSGAIRLHGSGEALYVITLPDMTDDELKALLRTLQLTAVSQ